MASGNTAHEDKRGDTTLSLESLRDFFMQERSRRESIRSQIGIPVSVMSFAAFGFVSFASNIDIGHWRNLPSLAMLGFAVVSLALLVAAMVYLNRVERTFSSSAPRHEIEPEEDGEERDFLISRLRTLRDANDAAAWYRARAFVLLMAALIAFLLAIALLPGHMAIANASAGLMGRVGEIVPPVPA